MLPDAVMVAHVCPLVHQLNLLPSLSQIQGSASACEDLPDLHDTASLVRHCEAEPPRGWSKRVTEFLHNNRPS